MGGIGSGRVYRGISVVTTSDVRHIDIRRFKRKGLLNPGNDFVWSWENEYGETTNTISVYVKQGVIELIYRHKDDDGEYINVTESVPLVYQNCHLGGQRVWFRCTRCYQNTALLYLRKYRFRCRKCQRLPYESQQETKADRLLRKARKHRARINASTDLYEPIWSKPSGMHWTTFNRHYEMAKQAEARYDKLVHARFGSLLTEQGFDALFAY